LTARSRLTALLVAVGLVVAAPTPAAPARVAGAKAEAACTRATIQGERKCIARGQYCRHTARANRDYHRYGYHCGKRDRNGRYHLISY
jgi:hypothetical protein